MQIRVETPGDGPAIHALVNRAFGRRAEADLVDDLRIAGDLKVSLVAEDSGRLHGHVALSRMRSPEGALALAPLSVAPEMQGGGIGTTLVRRALAVARDFRYVIVFVLGDPSYYARFGFSAEVADQFDSPYHSPHFMALWLTDARMAAGNAVHAEAFAKFT